jgi:hypothetical protein
MTTRSTMTFTPLAAALTLTAVGFLPTGATLADVNVPGLSCQAPNLTEAEGLRWHEQYIMNPRDGDRARWVVCPLAVETLIYPEVVGFWVSGVKAPGTLEFPVCAFNAVSAFNQDIPGFVDNPGASLKTIEPMEVVSLPGQNWAFRFITSRGFLESAVGDSLENQTYSVNCRLPPGYALQMVSLFPWQ